MGDLSPHFSTHEFLDHRTPRAAGQTIDPELVAVLERIRSLTGRPLPIVSGYRTEATNRAVGGVANSQHLFGRAADIPQGRATVEEALRAGARGVGYCNGWAVHVDVRPGALVTFRDCPKRSWVRRSSDGAPGRECEHCAG